MNALERLAQHPPLFAEAHGDIAVSFEFFPPKNERMAETLWESIQTLAPLQPRFVSVTYGAGGSTRERTHDLVARINQDTSMTGMAHLTCAAHARSELEGIVTRYRDAGIENILALGGDPPKDLDLPPGDLKHATELVALIRDIGDFSVGVAVHPEGHPASGNVRDDRRRQAEKLAVADFGLSQFFFDADVWFEFLGDLDALGVSTPVIPGIMPRRTPRPTRATAPRCRTCRSSSCPSSASRTRSRRRG
jgi:methylenetetrahydrofolate reductase (NADPH)